MKKHLLLCLTPLLLAACGQTAETEAQDTGVQYVEEGLAETEEGESSQASDQETEESSEESSSDLEAEDKTQEEINAEEGISAEQIVVKITDEGYVTTHGDHFHAYNGNVPEDSLIGERLFTEEEGEVVSDHIAGQVVNVNGEYFFKPSETDHKLFRTEEEIVSQSQGNPPGKTMPGGEFRNEDGKYETDDGYVFDPSQVSEDMGDGYLVPDGDMTHFIPKDYLTYHEIQAADQALKE